MRHSLLAAFVVALTTAVACGDPSSTNDGDDELPPRTALTDGESFLVSWDGPEEPLPFQELFEITVEVVEPDTGDSVDGLDVAIRALADGTTLETPTRPRVSPTDDGQYLVEGLLFHVPHGWEFVVDVDGGQGSETARFDIEPVGRYGGTLPDDPTATFSDEALSHILTMSPVPPPPPDPTNAVADDDDAAHLGRFLFFDARFSDDGTVACASCHLPEHGFSDPQRLSTGMGTTGRRSMAALNAAYHRWYFWDGRTDSLWSQALGPIESEVEHGITRLRLAHLLYEDDQLRQAYESIFGAMPPMDDEERFPDDARPVPDDEEHEHHLAWMEMSEGDRQSVDEVFANFGKALAAYQRRLVRNESDFDRFVEALRDGDEEGMEVLSDEARQGLKLFVGDGKCVDCHAGHQLTNFEFHNLGLAPRDWMPDGPDEGRSEGLAAVVESEFSAHGPHSDDPEGEAARALEFLREPSFQSDGAFKTPGLRNVAQRAPFMHGGHLGTLEETVEFYSDLQEDPAVGLRDPLLQQVNLDSDETSAVVAFMEALTGDPLPDELVEAPDDPMP